jgi:hypothetical protein
MKTTIELTPDKAAALEKYAALSGHTPAEFLNRYLEGNMMPLFENPRSGELESHLATLEYRTRADAERVVAKVTEIVRTRHQGNLPAFSYSEVHELPNGRFAVKAEFIDQHGELVEI